MLRDAAVQFLHMLHGPRDEPIEKRVALRLAAAGCGSPPNTAYRSRRRWLLPPAACAHPTSRESARPSDATGGGTASVRLAQLPHQIGHLDGGHGGVESLVAALGARPVDGLL